jgi:hypothetical protein
VSALAHPGVGQYLNWHFVSAFQKVATFEVNGALKKGGNVAAYFCTPEGRVLHALAGPVNADKFLREARWANETFQLAWLENQTAAQLQAFFRKAHLERLRREQHVHVPENPLPQPDAVSPKLLGRLLAQNAHLGLNDQGKVHLLLTVSPTPRLGQIYRVVFEGILNEKISTNPVAVAGQ